MASTELSPYRYAIDWRKSASDEVYQRDETRLHSALSRPDYAHAYPPPLFSENYINNVYAAGRAVRSGIADVFHRKFASSVEGLARFLGFEPRQVELFEKIATDRTIKMALAFARPDFNVTAQGIRLVECNFATSLGGINTIDPYNTALLETDLFNELPAGARVDWLQPSWAKAMYYFDQQRAQTSRHQSSPVLFYALASHTDSNRGFSKFRELASRSGYSAVAGRLDDLEVSSNGASFANMRVDIVLSGFTWSECKKHVSFQQIEKLVALDKLGAISYIAPPLYGLFDSKLLLAHIDPEHMDRRGFAEIVPLTVPVAQDNVDRILDAPKDDWILKPAGEFGGKEISVGEVETEASWYAKIVALAGEGSSSGATTFVAQQVVRPAAFEASSDSPCRIALSLGPLLFGQDDAGILARQGVIDASSSVPILNQKRGAMGSSAIRLPE
jgi:hypothetical protein